MELELHKTDDGYQVRLLGDNGVSVGEPPYYYETKRDAKTAAKDLAKGLEATGATVIVTDYSALDDDEEAPVAPTVEDDTGEPGPPANTA
jgi:hypothetical protein